MKRIPAPLPTLPVVAPFGILVALLGVVVALLAPLAASAAAPATSVRTISPLTDAGTLKDRYRISDRLGHGTCQRGSYMTGVADRCSTPDTRRAVLDPCWPAADPKTYYCQEKPWRHRVVRLHVPRPPTAGPGRHEQRLPWGMRLDAKVRCLLDVGSVRRLDGHALLYHCSRHRDVFGPLRRDGSHWKAHVYRTGADTRSGYKSLGWHPVRIAWYGARVTPAASPSPSPILSTAVAAPTST